MDDDGSPFVIDDCTKALEERMSEVEESIQYLEAITRLKESKFGESSYQSNHLSPINQTSPFGTAWQSADSLIMPRQSAPQTNRETNANSRRKINRSRYKPTLDFQPDISKRSNNASWHETRRDDVTTLRYSPDPRDGQNTSDSDDFYDDVPGYMRPLRRPMAIYGQPSSRVAWLRNTSCTLRTEGALGPATYDPSVSQRNHRIQAKRSPSAHINPGSSSRHTWLAGWDAKLNTPKGPRATNHRMGE